MTAVAEWTEAELRALQPARRLSVTQWAELHRQMVPPTARTGPWDPALLPYLIEPMDAIATAAKLVLIFGAQCGKTECLLNGVGWAIDQDPDPMLMVQPDINLAKAFGLERVRPMIEATPNLLRYRTRAKRDWTNFALRMSQCTIHLAGAGSPGELAGRAIRRVFMDEVDKYPRWSGREANPVDLARERTNTYPDRLIVIATTVTTEDANGWTEYLDTDQRTYWVPCQGCSTFQTLEFERFKVRGDERDRAKITRERLAYYECPHCQHEHDDNDANLRAMIDRGVWVPESCEVTKAGKVIGTQDSDHRGYRLPAFYSPIGPNWSELMALWFKVYKDPTGLMNFMNSKLARCFSMADREISDDQILALRDGRPAGRVPDRTDLVLTAGVDIGGPEDGPWRFHWAVRAWAPGMRSYGIAHGLVVSLDFRDLLAAVFRPWLDPLGRRHEVQACFVDTGYLTTRVMDWTMPHYPRCKPSKGFESASVPIRENSEGLQLVCVTYVKDYLATLLAAKPTDHNRWSAHQDLDEDYVRHMQSEHRVEKRKAAAELFRGAKGSSNKVWRVKAGVSSPHYLDCEVAALAAALDLGLQLISVGDTVGALSSQEPALEEPAVDVGGYLGEGDFGDWLA